MAPESLEQKLAQFLRYHRGEMTYTEFARKVGLGRVSLHRIETLQQSATLRSIQQILKSLHCSYLDIFEFKAGTSAVAERKQGLKEPDKNPSKVAIYPKAPRKKKK